MKHTKAPWFMNTTKRFMDNKGLAITDEKNRLICEVSHDLAELTLTEYKANAKLILAAPDLLRNLNSLLLSVMAHPYYVSGEEGDEWHDITSICEETIKKATE